MAWAGCGRGGAGLGLGGGGAGGVGVCSTGFGVSNSTCTGTCSAGTGFDAFLLFSIQRAANQCSARTASSTASHRPHRKDGSADELSDDAPETARRRRRKENGIGWLGNARDESTAAAVKCCLRNDRRGIDE
jgi:hypothetical protein